MALGLRHLRPKTLFSLQETAGRKGLSGSVWGESKPQMDDDKRRFCRVHRRESAVPLRRRGKAK